MLPDLLIPALTTRVGARVGMTVAMARRVRPRVAVGRERVRIARPVVAVVERGIVAVIGRRATGVVIVAKSVTSAVTPACADPVGVVPAVSIAQAWA
jgi:hypothetical protein